MPTDTRAETANNQLGTLLSGVWTMRMWTETEPRQEYAGHVTCSQRDTDISSVLMKCDWVRHRVESTETVETATYYYTIHNVGMYRVRQAGSFVGISVLDMTQRFFEQLIYAGQGNSRRLRLVFDAEQTHAQFRLSTMTRDAADEFVEINPAEAVRGTLTRQSHGQPPGPMAFNHDIPAVDTSHCSYKQSIFQGQPAVEVQLAGDLALWLPGNTRDWELRCGTEETRVPFEAVRSTEQSDRVVSFEVVDISPLQGQSESDYLGEVSALAAIGGVGTFGDHNADMDEVSLPGGRLGRLMWLARPSVSNDVTSIHGHTLGWLPNHDVMLLHVSDAGREPDRAAVVELLGRFGPRAVMAPLQRAQPPSRQPAPPP